MYLINTKTGFRSRINGTSPVLPTGEVVPLIVGWSMGDWRVTSDDGPYMLPKTTIIMRLTMGEAELFDTMVQESDARFRLLWNMAQPLSSNADYFEELRGGMIMAGISEDRVEEILSRETA